MRRLRLLLVGLLLSGVAAAWLLSGGLRSALSPQAVSRSLSSLLHLDVQCDSVRLAWGGQIHLRHLVVNSQEGTLLTASSADVQIVLADLWQGRVNAQSVTVNHPDLHLDLSAWQDWSQHLQADPLPGRIRILVVDGTLVYTLASGQSLSFQHLSARLHMLNGSLGGQAACTDPLGDEVHLVGTLRAPQMALRGTITQASVARMAAAAGWLSPWDGGVSLTFDVHGPLPDLSTDATLKMQGGLGTLAPRLVGTLHLLPAASFEGMLTATGGTGSMTRLQVPLQLGRVVELGPGEIVTSAGTIALRASVQPGGAARVDLSAHQVRVHGHGTLSNLSLGLTAPGLVGQGRLTAAGLSVSLRHRSEKMQASIDPRGHLAWTLTGIRMPPVSGRGELENGTVHMTVHALNVDVPVDVNVGDEAAIAQFNGQSIAELSPFLPWPVAGQVHGRIQVDGEHASGQLELQGLRAGALRADAVQIRGDGDWQASVPGLRLGAVDLGAVRVRYQHGEVTAAFDRGLALAGRLDLAQRRFVGTVSVPAVGKLVQNPDLAGRLTGRVTLGQAVAFAGRVVGVGGLSGSLQVTDTRWALSHATMDGQALPRTHGDLRLDGQDVMLQGSLPWSGSAFAALNGPLSFQARWRPSSPIRVEMVLAGHPAWRAEGVLDRSGMALSKLSSSSIGIVLAGRIDWHGETLTLTGSTHGTALRALMAMAGSGSSEVGGRVTGTITVAGPMRAPSLQFKGRATQLTWRGHALGSGRVTLACTPTSLQGKLQLDHRVGLSHVTFLSHIPLLGSVGNAVSIAGATISGTPQQPVITPQVRL